MDSSTEQQRQLPGWRPLSGRSLSRRAFVAASGATAATGILPATAGAQNGDDVEPVYTDAVISATVPTLDRDDYTGLFVQIVRLEAEAGIASVSGPAPSSTPARRPSPTRHGSSTGSRATERGPRRSSTPTRETKR